MGAPPHRRDARQRRCEPLAGAFAIDRDGLAHHPGRLGVAVPVLEAPLVVVEGGAGDAHGAATGELGRGFGGVASGALRPRFGGRRRNGGTRRRGRERSHRAIIAPGPIGLVHRLGTTTGRFRAQSSLPRQSSSRPSSRTRAIRSAAVAHSMIQSPTCARLASFSHPPVSAQSRSLSGPGAGRHRVDGRGAVGGAVAGPERPRPGGDLPARAQPRRPAGGHAARREAVGVDGRAARGAGRRVRQRRPADARPGDHRRGGLRRGLGGRQLRDRGPGHDGEAESRRGRTRR